MYLNVVEHAPITVPAYIKNVGVINRSMPTDETKAIDIIDKVLSLEGADLDKVCAQESIKVMYLRCSKLNKILTEINDCRA